MISVYPSASRFQADHGWLNSRFSFSFAEYYDPANLNFGVLRVLNDDIVQPGNGFGQHPHREMEIVSIVLRGALKHEDSTGNSEILRPGEVQRMTAGTGIIHSEENPSGTEEVNFLQLWFLPGQNKLVPSYEQIAYDVEGLKNQLLPIVSGTPQEVPTAHIHQDLTLYLSKPDAGENLVFEQAPGRKIFLFVIEGSIELQGQETLNVRDSARITDVNRLEIKAGQDSYFMLIDMP